MIILLYRKALCSQYNRDATHFQNNIRRILRGQWLQATLFINRNVYHLDLKNWT